MATPIPLRRYLSLQLIAQTLIPTVLIAVMAGLFLIPQMQADINMGHHALARVIAGEIWAHLMGGERQLAALADAVASGAVGVDEGDSDLRLTALLDAACGEGDLFETIYLVAEEDETIRHIGLARSTRARRNDLLGIDLSGRKLNKNARREVITVWSQTFLSTVSGRLAVAVAVPLPGRLLVGEITLEKLSQFISQLPVEVHLRTLVLDEQGRVVADSRQKRWGQHLDLTRLPPCGSTSGPEPASRSFFLDSVRQVGSQVAVERVGWKVLVAQTASTAQRPTRSVFIAIATGLALALILALVLARRQAATLSRFTEINIAHAKAIAAGHYDLQWPPARTIEDKELADSLRSMAAKIQRRERRLKDLTANVPGVVYQFKSTRDHDYTVTYVSGKALDYLGLTPSPDSFFQTFTEGIPAAERAGFVASIREAVDAAVPWNYEGRFIKPNGETIWFSGNSLPREEDEAIVFFGMLMDITQRKQIEQALIESEERFRKLAESALTGIYHIEDERFRYVNKAMADMFGYEVEEVVSDLKMLDLVDPADRHFVRENVRRRLEGADDSIRYVFRGLRRDGSTIYVEVHGRRICLAGKAGVIGTLVDITQQKEDEGEVRRLRNYLSNIIDSMPSMLIAVDNEGHVTQWNKTAELNTGIMAQSAYGEKLSQLIPSMATELGDLTARIKTRRGWKLRNRPRTSPGGTRYEDVTMYPLIADAEHGAVIRIDDVTEKVRLEEMMIQSEKMLSVGGLAAGMAHEINNPLAGIMQSASVIANRLYKDLTIPASQREAEKAGVSLGAIETYMRARHIPRMLDTIQSSCERVAEIVDNMLSFARKSEKTIAVHNIREIIEKTLTLAATDYNLKKQYDFKRIAIHKEFDEGVPAVECEGATIQQVLLNVFSNGAQALHGAGIENPHFIVRLYHENGRGMVCIEIEDNGPGMEEATRKRVFEPFFTTKPVGVGTGLGMSVSYFIITEQHQGEMEVISSPGSGARFVIRLPILRAPSSH